MQFPIDKDTCIQVLLREVTEVFILCHDTLVDAVDACEVGVRGGFVAVDFVAHDARGGGGGDEALHVEEVGAGRGKVRKMEDWEVGCTRMDGDG